MTTNHFPPRSNCNNCFSFSFTPLHYFGYGIPRHGITWLKKNKGTFGGILITVTFCLAVYGADSFHHSIWSQYLWSFSFLLRQMSDLLAQKRVFSFWFQKPPVILHYLLNR